jgi:tRNA A-37 threonylcarbamoyl transferase component Bud32
MTKYESVIEAVNREFAEIAVSDSMEIYENIYQDYRNQDSILDNLIHIFIVSHFLLNKLFGFLNDRIQGNKHYLADDSRKLIGTIENIRKLEKNLRDSAYEFNIKDTYSGYFSICDHFLKKTMGSDIPFDLQPFDIIEYDPIFFLTNRFIDSTIAESQTELKMIGSGSYANVFKFEISKFHFFLAVKALKKKSTEKEKERFRKEYDFMRAFNSPYILRVFSFDEVNLQYYMEFCDMNLERFLEKNNSSLDFVKRKKLALQFLQGIKQIHGKGMLHRDISYNNVLINCYDDDQYILKISDFGLCKSEDSTLTSETSEMKGTIRDPLLSSFKDYKLTNEIYAIGFILNFIFTGQKSPKDVNKTPLGKIIHKCISTSEEDRFSTLEECTKAVNQLTM